MSRRVPAHNPSSDPNRLLNLINTSSADRPVLLLVRHGATDAMATRLCGREKPSRTHLIVTLRSPSHRCGDGRVGVARRPIASSRDPIRLESERAVAALPDGIRFLLIAESDTRLYDSLPSAKDSPPAPAGTAQDVTVLI